MLGVVGAAAVSCSGSFLKSSYATALSPNTPRGSVSKYGIRDKVMPEEDEDDEDCEDGDDRESRKNCSSCMDRCCRVPICDKKV